MGKLKVLFWIGIGYVLGARAGRSRYEQIRSKARQFANNPTVQSTVSKAEETVRQQAPVVKDKVVDAAEAAAHKVGRHKDETSSTYSGATATGASSTGFPADPEQPRA